MGLDNFVSRSPGEPVLAPEDERALTESGISLCGGFHSDGVTSFRGKVYAVFVEAVTGESLYRDWLPPETVAVMAAELDACDPDTVSERLGVDPRFVPARGEIDDLRKLFRLCAERGLGIVAWS